MSSGKRFISKHQIVSAGDQSQATVTSTIMNVMGLDNIGVQVNITSGTATGAFDIQVSIDHEETGGVVIKAGTFVSLGSNYTANITSGSPSNVMFDLAEISGPYIQLIWTKTSGTGTFDAFMSAKAI